MGVAVESGTIVEMADFGNDEAAIVAGTGAIEGLELPWNASVSVVERIVIVRFVHVFGGSPGSILLMSACNPTVRFHSHNARGDMTMPLARTG